MLLWLWKERDSPTSSLRNKSFKHIVFICLSCLLCITRRMFKVKAETVLVSHHWVWWAYWKMPGSILHLCMRFLPKAIIAQSHLWSQCAAQSYGCAGRWGSPPSSLLPQQGHDICDPESGKWKQGLHHILLLTISDNCHNCKQPSGVLSVYHYLLLTILQTPASLNKGSLGPHNC